MIHVKPDRVGRMEKGAQLKNENARLVMVGNWQTTTDTKSLSQETELSRLDSFDFSSHHMFPKQTLNDLTTKEIKFKIINEMVNNTVINSIAGYASYGLQINMNSNALITISA